YMSPEQVGGEPLGQASDQFALGVTLVEMVTGARPFDGDGPMETMDKIRAAAPVTLSGIPDDVAAIVERCLARDPRARFADAEALRRALAEARRARPAAGPRELAAWVGGQ